NIGPITVTTGIRAFFNAWWIVTFFSETPFDLAVLI
ncbi:unnamed protein product, partial [marine sediment metagenome]